MLTSVRAAKVRVLLILAVFGVPSLAAAQLARVGDARIVNTVDTVFGAGAAYDPVNNVYLVVMAREHGADTSGAVVGMFVNTSGDPVGSPVVLETGARADFARAAFSPTIGNGAGGTGGFLVTWTQPFTGNTYAAVVAYPGLVSGTAILTPGYTGPADIAYSSISRMFAVVWETKATPASVTLARLFDGPLSVGSIPLAAGNAGNSWVIWNSNTSVAWNSDRDEFGVLYTRQASPWSLLFTRVTAGGVVVDTRAVTSLNAPPIAAAVQFNPATGHYVAVWADQVTGVITGAEVSGTGDVVATGSLPATILGSQNGMALSYNSTSGTFLLLGFTQMSGVEQVRGMELNKHGAPNSPVTDVTALPLTTNYFAPRAAARSDAEEWLVDVGSSVHYVQVVRTGSAFGGSELRLDGCYSPDPFAAMGGGTCYNGGWLPPGMTPPGGITAPPTQPPPPPQTPPPSGTSATGCATPDPFTAMGGGTCYNGGWLPPGMTPPSAAPPPSTPPPPAPTGCTTPDPFVVLGGGTCYNGGWLPPGMVIR